MQMLETKITSHNAETADIVMELKAEVDTLHDKLEVFDKSLCLSVCLSVSHEHSLTLATVAVVSAEPNAISTLNTTAL